MRLILGQISNPPSSISSNKLILGRSSYNTENFRPANSSWLRSQISLSTFGHSQSQSHSRDIAINAIAFSICSTSCPGNLRSLTSEEYKLLRVIFPETKAIAVAPPYLVIQVESLPSKPWPTSIAGAPLFLTTSTDLGYFHQSPGIGPSVLSSMQHSTHKPTAILMAVFQELSMASLNVESITLYGAFIAIELIGDAKFEALPRKIANMSAEYVMKTKPGVNSLPINCNEILPRGFFDGIATADEVKLGGDISMNSRFSGLCEGKILGIKAQFNLDINSEQPPQDFKPIISICYTFGNGQERALDGWYGSPIIDQDTNKIVSFVGKANKVDGVGYSVLAEEFVGLVKRI
ncbi:hypothetical protein N7495_001497 [Penicillium taxi]|uniref:uncharacterized protein n=1 Tax=Penicillium taxi TaxID=168475 RepID=UPI002545106B|nr:uncharacterized protein N7495_001497 [Penicillium taxi]KAJ5908815.1 hypothetical protein N7495_001497 [Penicillium taxi]